MFKSLSIAMCVAIAAASPLSSSGIEKRGYSASPDCNRFAQTDNGEKGAIIDGVNYLYAMSASAICGTNGDGSCGQVSCSNGAGIFVCSQAAGQYAGPTCHDVATYAQQIVGECTTTVSTPTSQGFKNQMFVSGNRAVANPAPGYFVDVRHGNC